MSSFLWFWMFWAVPIAHFLVSIILWLLCAADDPENKNNTKTTENRKQNKNPNELSQWSLKPSVSICSYLTIFSVIRRSPGIGRIVVHYHQWVGLVSCKSGKTRKCMLRASKNIHHVMNQPCYRKVMSIWKSMIFLSETDLCSWLLPPIRRSLSQNSRPLSHKSTKIRKYMIRAAQNIQNYKNRPNSHRVMLIWKKHHFSEQIL